MDSTERTEANVSFAGEKLTRLGNVSYGCLIKILTNFNVKELMNVVDYDIRVQDAARFNLRRILATFDIV